jgi:hypothetical protein
LPGNSHRIQVARYRIENCIEQRAKSIAWRQDAGCKIQDI